MKKNFTLHKFLFSFILLAGSSLFTCEAQWQQLTGLKGEPCYFLRSTATELFAGTKAGVLSSSNNGNFWAKEPDLYLTNVTDRISTSGDTIVVYADPDSYLSLDNGVTWTEINAPAGGGVYVTGMITENGMLYAGTDGDYFYKSSDWGANWVQVTANITNPTINFTAASGNTVFLATDDGIFRSTDQGATFAQTFGVLGGFTFVYSDGSHAFAYGDNGIAGSNNNGATWTDFNSPILFTDITDFLVDGSTVYAATVDQLMKSDVTSANWSEVNFNQSVDFCFALCKQGSEIFAGTNRGVFATSDQGVTWTEKNDGITPLTIEGLAVHQGSLFAGASIYGISTYQNNTWDFSGLGLLNSFDFASVGTDIYAANELGIYQSPDTGATWTVITPLGSTLPSFCAKVAVYDSLILGASIQNGVLRSGDFGANWTIEANGLNGSQVSSVAVSGNNIVVGTYANGIYVSDDAGFFYNYADAPSAYISDLATIGSNVLASSYDTAGCYLSTNNGVTWSSLSTPNFDDLSSHGSMVLANTTSDIYLSLDSGQTFMAAIPGPAGVAIANSVASDSTIYVSTYADGVWKISISTLLSVKDLSATQPGFTITPNIFNEETTIMIDDALLVKQPLLMLSDASGKIVRKIRLQQSQTRLLANDLPSGVYFALIVQDGVKIKAQKLVIYK